jgi:exodeoxyribonuclease X
VVNRVFIIDTETTGLEPSDCGVCEIAAVVVSRDDGGGWRVGDGAAFFVDPGRPIPPEASGLHDIVDADVAGAGPLRDVLARLMPADARPVIEKGTIFAAHNAPFEIGFLTMLRKARWVDTLQCALHIWPDAPNHKNSTLRYYLGLALPSWLDASEKRNRPHGALFDTAVTAATLCRMLDRHTLVELIDMSNRPAILHKVNFGEHFGKPWSEVPTSYLEWILRNGSFDRNVVATVDSILSPATTADKASNVVDFASRRDRPAGDARS